MNGNFYTYFGWGFGFGDFFPHPTTGDPANNGQPYVTTAYGSVDYFDQNLNEYDEYDGYFTVSYLIDPDYPYGEGGIITFTGYFVYDSSSPTDVSIMPGLPPVDWFSQQILTHLFQTRLIFTGFIAGFLLALAPVIHERLTETR